MFFITQTFISQSSRNESVQLQTIRKTPKYPRYEDNSILRSKQTCSVNKKTWISFVARGQHRIVSCFFESKPIFEICFLVVCYNILTKLQPISQTIVSLKLCFQSDLLKVTPILMVSALCDSPESFIKKLLQNLLKFRCFESPHSEKSGFRVPCICIEVFFGTVNFMKP